jgi:hypothetical protein
MEHRTGTSALDQEVCRELRAVLGAEHVCTSAEDLDRYSRCTIPWQSICAAVVFPASTEEVAAIVRIAARHRLPLWPSSTGLQLGLRDDPGDRRRRHRHDPRSA